MAATPTSRRSFWRVPIVLVTGFIALAAGGPLEQIRAGLDPSLAEQLLIRFLLSPHTAMIVVSLILILVLARGRFSSFGFRLPKPIGWVRLVILVCGVFLVSHLIGRLIDAEELPFMEEYTLLDEIVLIWIWASIGEEVLTRGWMQGYLEPLKSYGISVASIRLSLPVILCAAVFGAMHLTLFTFDVGAPTVWMIVISAFVIGLVAGYYREKSESLVPAYVAHALANVVGWILGRITGG
jgi:membrane protease YdiL (CAAX protease family)